MVLDAQPAAVLVEAFGEGRQRRLRLEAGHLAQLRQLIGLERSLGDEEQRLVEGAEVVGHERVSTRIGPNSSSCSAPTSRRRTSSRVARNVTATSVRDRHRARIVWSRTRPPPARAVRRTAICWPMVISRATTSGGGGAGSGIAASVSSAAARIAGRHRRRWRGGKVGLARLAAHDRRHAVALPELGGRIAQGAVLEQAATQLVLVGLIGAVGQRRQRLGRQHPLRLQVDQLGGDRDELRQGGHVDRVMGEVLDVGVGDVGQRHGQDVELARLDEMEEQPQRALEDRQGHREGPVADRDGDARIGLDRDRLHAAQDASSAAFSAAWSGASVSRGCPRMKSPVRGSQPARTRHLGRDRLVMEVEVERIPPRARVRAGEASKGTRRDGLEQDAGDPVPEAKPMTLAGIVEERRGEHVAIVVSRGQQAMRDVEAMTSIRDRHRPEQRLRRRWQDALDERLLRRVDAGPHVGDELADSMHRSAPPSAAAPSQGAAAAGCSAGRPTGGAG